jgi:hypothetical protein
MSNKLLPPLAFFFVRWWLVAAQRKEGCDEPYRRGLYDESYERMDEWLDGRRDVDLDADRRTGGGSSGYRDYQVSKK